MTTPTASSSTAAAENGGGSQHQTVHAWEDSGMSWSVQEDEEGNIILSQDVVSPEEAIRRRRMQLLHKGDYCQKRRKVVRDMIRHVFIILDASRWMLEKDAVLGSGTRFEIVLSVLQSFVLEFFDQNPLSHLGLIILRNGEAEILTHLSSNIKTHKLALESLARKSASSCGGEFSLQNGLELAGRSLGHLPRYASREVVVVMGALSTCDPGSLLVETLPRLLSAHVRVSTLALAAELHVTRKLAEETGGILGVCLNKATLRDWLLLGQVVPPPAVKKNTLESGCDMVLIGFPTRSTDHAVPTLVHATRDTKVLSKTAYTCPQCQAKVLELPTDCAVCGLKLVLAPHLARSFHHLFPVPPFTEVNDGNDNGDNAQHHVSSAPLSSTLSAMQVTNRAIQEFDSNILVSSKECQYACFACLKYLGRTEAPTQKPKHGVVEEEKLRFQCPECENIFCADCDAYLHETLHNCPGCLAV